MGRVRSGLHPWIDLHCLRAGDCMAGLARRPAFAFAAFAFRRTKPRRAGICTWAGVFQIGHYSLVRRIAAWRGGIRHHLFVDRGTDQRLQLHGRYRWPCGRRGVCGRHRLDVAFGEHGKHICVLGCACGFS